MVQGALFMFQKAVLVSALIENRRMCLPCLSRETALTPEVVETVIAVLARSLVIQRYSDKYCDECGTQARVFVLERK
jgi:hypothetical protein